MVHFRAYVTNDPAIYEDYWMTPTKAREVIRIIKRAGFSVEIIKEV